MNTAFDSLTHKMQRAALGKTVDLVLSHAEKDPAKTVGQIVDLSKQFYGDSFSEETYEHAHAVLADPDSKWSKLINCMLNQLDPNVARTTALNLGYEAFFRGTKTIRENRVKYQCNIPWLILFDPTSACNMHCVGCWAGEYGHKNNLSFEDMDKIVTEGKALGVYLYMLTGGEPLIRKNDIIELAANNQDCVFLIYTNATLVDQKFCDDLKRVGNVALAMSIEGTEESNDWRRGEGAYNATLKAMERAILASDIGITPVNDGKVIRLVFPQPTEERRKELVKQVQKLGEEAKIAVRNIRRDAMDAVKKMQKDGDISEDEQKKYETEIQNLTDTTIKAMDEMLKAKEQEIKQV